MSLKTNKSYIKRFKVSRNGKVRSRGRGQNHFNAKESRSSQLDKKRAVPFSIKNRDARRFLPGQMRASGAK